MKTNHHFSSETPSFSPDAVSAELIISELKTINQKQATEIQVLTTKNNTLTTELELLKHHMAMLQRALFGKKSEKPSEEEWQQLSFVFNEAEIGSVAEQEELPLEAPEETIVSYTRKKPGRKPLPENLPRKQVIHDLPDSEKHCPCGCMLTKIGEETSEQLDYIPATLQIIEHVRYKYACKSCEDTVKRAAPAVKPLPKAQVTAGFLSHIITSKFEDHLPLYRQSQMWERAGIEIPRATLCNWVIACGQLLTPLIELMKRDIASADYVCSDETTVQVLQNAGTAYMWVHMTGLREKRAIVYDYHPSRSGEKALAFLAPFQGYHQSDAYSGYEAFHQKEGITAVGCFAHARRKFYEITKISKTPGLAHRIVTLIGSLYKIEREAEDKQLDPGGIHALRQEKALPVLAKIKTLLDDHKDTVLPKGVLGKAIAYSLNQWVNLTAYTKDGRLRIDNNDCERTIRPFALGRKNWLFSATEKGAEVSATLYSLLQTCKANKINGFTYLRYVLGAIHASQSEADLCGLLPYRINTDLLAL